MRRRTGIVLSALGAFLLVFALLIRFVVAPSVVKFPLNEDSVSTVDAQDANYFSVSKLSELTGVTLQETVTVQGDSAAGNSSRAVWNEFSYLRDETNNLTVDYFKESLAFNRKTAELYNCCGSSVGTSSAHLSGLGFVWPLGAQKKTYSYFNTTLLKAEPVVYAGTAVIDGLATYKYVQKIAPTKSGSETLPGSLVGLNTSKNVTLPEYYQGTSTFYVAPTVGAPVLENIDEHLYLVDSSGTEVLNLMDGDFITTAASVSSAVSAANSRDTEVELVRVILPVVIGLVGLVLLLVGLVLGWPARRRGDESYEDESGTEQAGDEEYEPRHGAGEVPA
jgi:Porin PorA